MIVSGPVEALVASAAVQHLSGRPEAPRETILVLESVYSGHDEHLRRAVLACAAAVEWDAVVDVGRDGLAAVAGIARRPERVVEVMSVRNWHGYNRALLDAFPDARRVVYGDTYGSVDSDLKPSAPRFQVAVAPIPRATVPAALAGLEVEVIPRRTVRRVLAAVRERDAELRAADAALSRFARGGTLTLTSCETEAARTCLRAEVTQGYVLARRAARRGQTVVIKPHPRASLGQASAVARRLRRHGHEVRLVPSELGYYPIELFEELVQSVDSVQVGYSSAALPLAYLYGLSARVELPRLLAAITFFPHAGVESRSLAAYHRRAVGLLASWDGRSVLAVRPPRRLPGLNAVGSRLFPRLLGWSPRGGAARPGPWSRRGLEAELQARGAAHERTQIMTDDLTASLWALPTGLSCPRFLETLTASPLRGQHRIRALLAALRNDLNGSVFLVGAAVMPATHLPRAKALTARWRGASAPEGSVMSAEELELELEAVAQVMKREPELSSASLVPKALRLFAASSAAIPPGCVIFTCVMNRETPVR